MHPVMTLGLYNSVRKDREDPLAVDLVRCFPLKGLPAVPAS